MNAGIELAVAFDAHQLATVGRMVSEGMGVAVVPSNLSPTSHRNKGHSFVR